MKSESMPTFFQIITVAEPVIMPAIAPALVTRFQYNDRTIKGPKLEANPNALGVFGYFMGTRRLATITVILCVAALFLGLAASQGLIPGIDATDRTLPANEPAAE